MKKKIGLDIDDVIIDFNTGFLKFFNDNEDTKHTRYDCTSPFYEETFNVPREKVYALLNTFFDSVHHLEIPPVVGAVNGLQKLTAHEIVLISARPEHSRKHIVQWIEKHLTGLVNVHTIILTGQYHNRSENIKTKGQIAKELGLDIFVDDALHNATEIVQHGVPVLLYDTPWNQIEQLPSGIIRVKSWDEILKHISQL